MISDLLIPKTPTILNAFALILICAVFAACDPAADQPVEEDSLAARTGFWYEENNVTGPGGYPDDLYEMFAHPETWSELRSNLDTYILRGNTLEYLMADPDYGEAFFRDHFIPVLNEAGITLAIDNPQELEGALRTVVDMGVNLSHLSLQSAVSKTKDEPELVQARVDRAVEKLTAYKEAYPDVKVGFGDATPTKGREYRSHYREIAERMKENGYSLDFVHLDAPFEAMQSQVRFTWDGVKEAEHFVRDSLGIDFGFICTSRVSREMRREGKEDLDVARREFFERVVSIPEHYEDDGSLPDYFILNAWYEVPDQSVPEDAPEGEYPMTKVALHLVRAIQNAYSAPQTS